jgi:multidrug efflux pump
MKVTDIAIENKTGIIVLTFLLIIAGTFTYLTIPKESNPSIEVPLFIITTLYPGIGPSDMESLVTQPLERELQGINGVKEIRSTTQESFSSVVVEFELDVPMNEASQRVRERVDLAKPNLPVDAEDPLIIEFDLDDFPIMVINLAADYPLSRLTKVSERLQDMLETVSGVREVELIGGIEREVQVNVDLNALNSYNLSFQQLIGAIQQQNLTIPGGTVDVERQSYLVRISGEFADPRLIEDLVIFVPGGEEVRPGAGMVYMRDVADVVYGFKDRESYSRLKILQTEDDEGRIQTVAGADADYRQVVSLNIKKRPGANIIETAGAVRATLTSMDLPPGTDVVITGDQSEDVESLIKDLENSIISGMLFVVLILVFFLGIRNALLVGTAVPLSILVGFIVLQAMGYTVNFIILFSLIIALGLLVDNAIVIVENIYRFREAGFEKFAAAREATSEVGYALIASTATLVAAFTPLLFWPGIIGQFMGYLPMTLIIVLLCSLLVALVIYPVLTGYLVRLDAEPKEKKSTFVKSVLYAGIAVLAFTILLANWITFVVSILTVIFFVATYKFIIKPLSAHFTTKTLPGVIEWYRSFLTWMLKRDYTVKRPLLRNTFALGSFTLGVLVLILGGIMSAISGTAGQIVLVAGGILAVAGIIGIVVHCIESMLLGTKAGMKAGLVTGLIIAAIIASISFTGKIFAFKTILVLMAIPAFLIVFGLMGMVIGISKRKDTHLILTDNRAKLLNGVMGVLFAIFAMLVISPTGQEFFPITDPRLVNVNIEGPIGLNIETSNETVQYVQSLVDELLEEDEDVRANVKNIVVNIGVAGNPFFGGGFPRPEKATIGVNFVDYGDRVEPTSNTLDKLRAKVRDIPDMKIQIEAQQDGPPTGAPVNIEVSGEDFSQIMSITQEITQILLEASETGATPGLVDIRNNIGGGLPEHRILIDHQKASQYGLSLAQIAQTVRIANNGLEASKFRDGEDEYDIMVRLREQDRRDLESLQNLRINAMGNLVPLVAVADFVDGSGLGSITRLNMRRTAVIEGDAAVGFSGPEVLEKVQAHLADYVQNLPVGYDIKYTGESEDQDESFGFLTQALFLIFALIFLIMLVKFNSLATPFIIITAVGLSLIGVLLGLILTQTNFGLMTFIGIISLAGIVCINNIVLMEYISQLLDKGMSKTQAIIEAGAIRFRPVLLTALTTILGLVPLTFGINIDFVGLFSNFDPNFQIGSENTAFWGPMGIAIISGLTFATFLTLVVVPVIYSTFDSVGRRMSLLVRGSTRD